MSSKTLDFECALVTGGAGGLVSFFVNEGTSI
jgi:hypothetical protein